MRICDRWMQESTTDRRGRSHPPQCTTSLTHLSATPRWSDSSLETPWRENAEQHHHTAPAQGITVWDSIGYHSRTPLVRIAGTLNSQCYISKVLEPIVLPYLQCLATAIFQQNNAGPHITSPAATPDQLWQHVDAAWSAVPQEHIQSVFKSMPRRYDESLRNLSTNILRRLWGL
ncbi:transposable element Tcb1 transposase [Trichonephila clavipes]|nr:transposable element Tcb1 transposase [Trichonephila clavipes]